MPCTSSLGWSSLPLRALHLAFTCNPSMVAHPNQIRETLLVTYQQRRASIKPTA